MQLEWKGWQENVLERQKWVDRIGMCLLKSKYALIISKLPLYLHRDAVDRPITVSGPSSVTHSPTASIRTIRTIDSDASLYATALIQPCLFFFSRPSYQLRLEFFTVRSLSRPITVVDDIRCAAPSTSRSSVRASSDSDERRSNGSSTYLSSTYSRRLLVHDRCRSR